MKKKINWEEIFVHDVEVAAFVIVSLMLVASITSYALDTNKVENTQRFIRNPMSVTLQDVNGDGLNDIILIHQSGAKEIVLTNNK